MAVQMRSLHCRPRSLRVVSMTGQKAMNRNEEA